MGKRDSDPARETESSSYSGAWRFLWRPRRQVAEARKSSAPPPLPVGAEPVACHMPPPGSPWPSGYHLSGWHKPAGPVHCARGVSGLLPRASWCAHVASRHPAEPGGDAAPAAPPAPEPVAVKAEPEGKERPKDKKGDRKEKDHPKDKKGDKKEKERPKDKKGDKKEKEHSKDKRSDDKKGREKEDKPPATRAKA